MALRLTFGLALYAHALFAFGVAGWLRPIPILALSVVFAAVFVRMPRPRLTWLVSAPLVVLALYPPIAFDETLYHLPFVQAFVRDGGIRFLADFRFPVFPVLHEVLCVPPFLLGGDIATHLVSFVEVLLIAALLVEWDARAGWLAATLFLGSPLVVQLATVLHVEMALTLFVVAGFLALDRDKYALAGFFLGSACSVKYLGFYFVAAGLGVVGWRLAVGGWRGRPWWFVGTSALAALPMTVWIWVHTGDPLFPFLRPTVWSIGSEPAIAIGERATRLARLVWDVTFARDRVGMQPPVTPFLALLVVGIVVAAVQRDRLARTVLFFGVPYVVIFTFLPQDSRYLVPLLALISLPVARVLVARWPGAVALLAILAIAPGMAYAGYRIARQGLPPVQRAVWLAERIPEYSALRLAGGSRVYGCGAEELKAHAGGRFLGDHNGPWSYARVLTGAGDTRTLSARLRRIGVGHYLVSKRECPPPRANGGMLLVYEDAAAQLWRVDEPN